MQEVTVPATDPRLLAQFAHPERVEELLAAAALVRQQVDGAAVVCVNATPAGGGVAEMLEALLPYVRGAGIDARWLALDGDERFFAITKRLHNHLHGAGGDGGPLTEAEHMHYQEVLRRNAAQLAASVRADDVVILHDPQTAGLAEAVRRRGARVIWRCHIGTDEANSTTELGWRFLQRYLDPALVDGFVFTRRGFAPPWLPPEVVFEIPPSIDPLAPKNQELTDDDGAAILAAVGLISGKPRTAEYRTRDGVLRRIDHDADLVRAGPLPDADVPLVVQVSRWDRLKDMVGVMRAFAEFVIDDHDSQLVLAGPAVSAVADDPEGAQVLSECLDAWRRLPHHARRRITLACLPMADRDENATIVNALQRHAAVVVQKSLAEGFGLTVSEAMFKRRAVVASAVGGIADQIVDGESGILLRDPRDGGELASALSALVPEPDRRAVIGGQAHDRVVDRFLPDSQLLRWCQLMMAVADRR
jgi:trehalose synthase